MIWQELFKRSLFFRASRKLKLKTSWRQGPFCIKIVTKLVVFLPASWGSTCILSYLWLLEFSTWKKNVWLCIKLFNHHMIFYNILFCTFKLRKMHLMKETKWKIKNDFIHIKLLVFCTSCFLQLFQIGDSIRAL